MAQGKPYQEAMTKHVEALSASRKALLILLKLQEQTGVELPEGLSVQTQLDHLDRKLMNFEPAGLLQYSSRNMVLRPGHQGWVTADMSKFPDDKAGALNVCEQIVQMLCAPLVLFGFPEIKSFVSQAANTGNVISRSAENCGFDFGKSENKLQYDNRALGFRYSTTIGVAKSSAETGRNLVEKDLYFSR